jgi:glycosyltransferase involved in cell wall biosynthesis
VAERLSSLSFFFPAYDEEDSIEPMVSDALTILPSFADDLEVIIVDDGSHDRTPEIADAQARRDPRVRVIHHRPNRGYGGAIRSGLVASTKEFVFFTDGDRQFDLRDLSRLVPLLDTNDVVIGYRLKRMDPRSRLVIAWVYNRFIRVLFGGGFKDVDCAFKLFRRSAFERMPIERVRSNGAFFSPELLIKLRAAGVRMAQVGVPHYPRRAQEPKGATPRVILRAIRDLLLLRLRMWAGRA